MSTLSQHHQKELETYVHVSKQLGLNFSPENIQDLTLVLPESKAKEALAMSITMRLVQTQIAEMQQQQAADKQRADELLVQLNVAKKKYEESLKKVPADDQQSKQLEIEKKQYERAVKQWDEFMKSLDQIGLQIATLQKELDTLVEAQSAFTKQTLQQVDTLRQNYKAQLTAFINNPANQAAILNSSIPLSPSVVPAGTDVSQLSQATIIQAKVATLTQVTQNVPTRTGSLNKAYELREDELNQLPAEERHKTSEAFKETSVKFWTVQDHMMYLVFYMHETNRSLSQARNDLKLLQEFFDHRQSMIVELMQEIDKTSDQRKTNIHALMARLAKLPLQSMHDQANALNITIGGLSTLQVNILGNETKQAHQPHNSLRANHLAKID